MKITIRGLVVKEYEIEVDNKFKQLDGCHPLSWTEIQTLNANLIDEVYTKLSNLNVEAENFQLFYAEDTETGDCIFED